MDLPRLVQLAVLALERLPDCRQIGGKRTRAEERKVFERNNADLFAVPATSVKEKRR